MSASQWEARRSLGASLVSLGTVFLLVAGLLVVFEGPNVTTAAAGGSTGLNQVSDWCDQGEKFEPITDPFIVPAPPAGTVWTLLVLKAGSGPDENTEFPNPVVGQGYSHNSDQTPANSHAILCYEDLGDPTLTLTKTVVGGTAGVGDFTLTVTPSGGGSGTNVTSGTPTTFAAGSYVVSETGPSAYSASVWGGDCNADGTITMIAGVSYACTITNTSTEAVLSLTKIVSGGTASVGDFTLTVTPNGGSGVNVTSGVATKFDPGSYTMSETGPPGYTAGSWGGHCATDGSLTMVAGETYACTITNTVINPTLTLTKTVVGGTAQVGNFTLTVTGPSPSSTETNVTSGVATEFAVGSYVVSETGPTGYNAGTWGGNCDANGNITMSAGGTYSCTITNSADPVLTLTKVVVGGTASVGDFTLTVTPNGGTGVNVTSGIPTEFDPGSYTMSESGPAGYDAGDWGGACAANGTLTMVAGETYECTISNVFEEEQGQTLTLVKRVVGGNDLPDDFNLIVTGPSPATTTTVMPSGTPVSLEPGAYTASETLLSGYIAGDWGGDCGADGTVTLSAGEHKVCTITNTTKPTLTLTKTWQGDDDPTGFSMQVTDNNSPFGVTAVTAGTPVVFEPGSYTASETLPSGYEATDWGGDCAADGSILLVAGETYECTITNSEIPTLTLIKVVIGGDAEPDDFGLIVTGPGTTGTVTPMLSEVSAEFEPGDYVASEGDLVGDLALYISRGWTGDCDAETGAVTLAYGDHKTCTITNVDPIPKLTLIKIVIGGNASPDDFNLAVLTDPGGVVTAVLSGVKNDFAPGDYIATETNLPGYAPGSWTGDCDPDGSVTLAAIPPEFPLVIDDLTCTITNIATTTTTTGGGTTSTQQLRTTTTTDPGGTTTTTLVLGANLPNTGGGQLIPILLGGFGLMLLGAGLILLAPRRQPRWVV